MRLEFVRQDGSVAGIMAVKDGKLLCTGAGEAFRDIYVTDDKGLPITPSSGWRYLEAVAEHVGNGYFSTRIVHDEDDLTRSEPWWYSIVVRAGRSLLGRKDTAMMAKSGRDVSGEARIPKGQAHGGEWTKVAHAAPEEGAQHDPMLDPDNQPQVFELLDTTLPLIQGKIDKLNQKAAKLGAPRIELVIGPAKIHQERNDDDDIIQWTTHEVSVKGEAPKLNGWTFCGTLAAVGEGGERMNLLSEVPGQVIPREYREADPEQCDHCQQRRKRTETFVLRKDETGEHKQVGRNCLRDFLGHEDPEAVLRYVHWMESALAALRNAADADADIMNRPGSRGKRMLDVPEYLAWVAEEIKRNGWVSAKTARANSEMYAGDSGARVPMVSTATSARGMMEEVKRKGLGDWRDNRWEPDQDSRKLAAAALEWLRETYGDYQGDENIWWNMRLLTQSDAVDPKGAGLLAYGVQHYKQHLDKEAAEADRKRREASRVPQKPSEWVGEVGERQTFILTVVGEQEIQSDFGSSTLYTMKDPSGNIFKWFASGYTTIERGKTYRLKATVKKHDDWKGQKQTVISRATPVPSREEKARVEAHQARVKEMEASLNARREANTAKHHQLSEKYSGVQGVGPYGWSNEGSPVFNDQEVQAFLAESQAISNGWSKFNALRYSDAGNITGEVVEGETSVEEKPAKKPTAPKAAKPPKPAKFDKDAFLWPGTDEKVNRSRFRIKNDQDLPRVAWGLTGRVIGILPPDEKNGETEPQAALVFSDDRPITPETRSTYHRLPISKLEKYETAKETWPDNPEMPLIGSRARIRDSWTMNGQKRDYELTGTITGIDHSQNDLRGHILFVSDRDAELNKDNPNGAWPQRWPFAALDHYVDPVPEPEPEPVKKEAKGKSAPKDESPLLLLEQPAKRGRGRPPGSKNKPKDNAVVAAPVEPEVKRGRGRPKGSKNKPRTETQAQPQAQPAAKAPTTTSQSPQAEERRGRGRPAGMTKEKALAHEQSVLDMLDRKGNHTVIESWLLDEDERAAVKRLIKKGVLVRGTDETDARRAIFYRP